jgi:broad specificity phosphatase PhoE
MRSRWDRFTIGSAGREPEPPLTKAGRRQANAVAKYFGRIQGGPYPVDHLIVSPMLRALETALPIAKAAGLDDPSKTTVWPEVCECGGVFGADGQEPPDGRACFELTRAEIAGLAPGWGMHASISDKGWWRPGRKELTGEMLTRTMAVVRVMRGWAESGHVTLPTVEEFASLRADAEVLIRALEAGEVVEVLRSRKDPPGAGAVDADTGTSPAFAKGGEESWPGPMHSVAVVCHHDVIDHIVALLANGDVPPPRGELGEPKPTLHFVFHNCSVTTIDLYAGGTTRFVRVNDVRHMDPVYTMRRGLLSGFWQDDIRSPPEEWDGEDDPPAP